MYHCLRFHLHGQSVSAAVAASSALSARSTAAPAAAASLCARSECDVVSAAAAVACRLSRAWPPCRRHHARSCDGLDHRKAAPRHRQALNEEEMHGPSRTGHRERNWPGSRAPALRCFISLLRLLLPWCASVGARLLLASRKAQTTMRFLLASLFVLAVPSVAGLLKLVRRAAAVARVGGDSFSAASSAPATAPPRTARTSARSASPRLARAPLCKRARAR